MKKKIPWLVVSCLMVVSLILASCAPAAAPEEEKEAVKEKEVVKEKEAVKEEVVGVEKEMVVDALGRTVEKPRYGGTLIQMRHIPSYGFDETMGRSCGSHWVLKMTNQSLVAGDWALGEAGTGKTSWTASPFPGMPLVKGIVAESWEIPNDTTMVFHIRKGIHFAPADKAPTNGRELTADDVVFSMKRQVQTPTSYIYAQMPWDIYFGSIEAVSWEGSDPKWTVVVKTQPGKLGIAWELLSQYGVAIIPRDFLEVHGDLIDWRNNIGTGPFMMTDYIPNVSTTLVRNPDYWGKQPLYPDDQAPYLDGVKILVIPDLATRLAALRTGKVDVYTTAGGGALQWESIDELIRTAPEVQYKEVFDQPYLMMMFLRVDKPELPIYDVRVRRALALATDQPAILESFYGGRGKLYNWPIMEHPVWDGVFTPLDELPESNQELYGYHPEKAKQLLAEAGYPDGFKMSIETKELFVDLLSIIVAQWKDVLNVDLELNVNEHAVWTSIYQKKSYDASLIYPASFGRYWYKFPDVTPGQKNNGSMVNDPFIEEQRVKIMAEYFDRPKMFSMMKELTVYMNDMVLSINLPAYNYYVVWQPWLKDYRGEDSIGYLRGYGDWAEFIWYDQDLKEEMTGTR